MSNENPLTPFIGSRSSRILVVDDDQGSLLALAGHLRRWHCQVETAVTGAQARIKARKFAPDLILLDVMLPDQSGFSVCEALQADPATLHIPVIFLTALTATEAKLKGFETGGYDYMTKPFDAGELAARVGAKLRVKYAEDTLRDKHSQLSSNVQPNRD
jgi:DNA-binding response OmpR family regulator